MAWMVDVDGGTETLNNDNGNGRGGRGEEGTGPEEIFVVQTPPRSTYYLLPVINHK